MFESLLRDWSFIRVVRLVLGIMLIGQSFQMQSWAIGLFGGLFVFQSITNTGCCGSTGGGVPRSNVRQTNKSTDEIEYEEVK